MFWPTCLVKVASSSEATSCKVSGELVVLVLMVKVTQYTVVNFREEFKDERGARRERVVLLIYALGEDGIVYEMSGGKWLALPIEERLMRDFTPKPAAPGDSR